jgi:hypothetical protein
VSSLQELNGGEHWDVLNMLCGGVVSCAFGLSTQSGCHHSVRWVLVRDVEGSASHAPVT